MSQFDGRSVIVTGAGSGIGAATARVFSAAGAYVTLVGRREDKLEKVAGGLDKSRTLVHPGDISERADIDKLVQRVREEAGRIDVLVNNAGTASGGRLDDFSAEEWDRIQRINVSGVFHCCQAAIGALRESGAGSIVNVSSVSGLGGDWGMFAYNASKGAVSNLTRALALDLAPEVRVNAVAPSLTWTEMSAGMKDNQALIEKFAERIPMGRGADPAEVADVILFLASEAARFVTGVVLPVDGGLSASNGQPRLG